MIAIPKCRTIRHNFLRIMKLVESMRGFIVPLLAIIAGFLISLPSEGQTGKRLSASDLKNIDDITRVAMNAALARDFATWASLFLEDAVINPPNEPAVKGRAAIRAWLEKFPPMTEFKLKNEKVEGGDDLGYVLGTYTMTITPPGAPGPVKDSGKFVTIVRRQPDGRWLCAVDMFSSDLPPPPPPPPK
jgi:uncharacterized protein (TIGR02246 family)